MTKNIYTEIEEVLTNEICNKKIAYGTDSQQVQDNLRRLVSAAITETFLIIKKYEVKGIIKNE